MVYKIYFDVQGGHGRCFTFFFLYGEKRKNGFITLLSKGGLQ